MAQGKLVVVKRQYKDQVWREAISLQEYQQWEQTHGSNFFKGVESPRISSRWQDSETSDVTR